MKDEGPPIGQGEGRNYPHQCLRKKVFIVSSRQQSLMSENFLQTKKKKKKSLDVSDHCQAWRHLSPSLWHLPSSSALLGTQVTSVPGKDRRPEAYFSTPHLLELQRGCWGRKQEFPLCKESLPAQPPSSPFLSPFFSFSHTQCGEEHSGTAQRVLLTSGKSLLTCNAKG